MAFAACFSTALTVIPSWPAICGKLYPSIRFRMKTSRLRVTHRLQAAFIRCRRS